jgi:hypothetical protein
MDQDAGRKIYSMKDNEEVLAQQLQKSIERKRSRSKSPKT